MNAVESARYTLPTDWTLWTEYNPSALQKNLDRLKERRPDLYSQLESIYREKQFYLRAAEGGVAECAEQTGGGFQTIFSRERLQTEWTAIQASLRTFSAISEYGVVMQLGCDPGGTFDLIFNHLQQAILKELVVIEPEIHWFALSLASRSYVSFLQSDRVRFILGEGWLEEFETIFLENHFFVIDRPEIFLSATARLSNRLPLFNPLKAKLGEWIREGRRAYTSELEATREYYRSKAPDRIETILALYLDERDGKAIPYIQGRFLDECRRLGIDVVYHRPGFRSDVGFLRTVAREKPDLLLFINKSVGEFTDLQTLDGIRVPRMVWCLDDPNSFLRDPFSQNDFVFTWDDSYKGDLESKQAKSVDGFPYVADMDGVESHVMERFRSPVSFVGQVVRFSPDALEMDEKTGLLVERVGALKADNPQENYQKLILQHQDDFGIKIIESESEPIPRFIRYGIYLVANARRRISILEAAVPFGLKIYGNEDWLTLLEGNPMRDCYAGLADPMREVPHIFASSAINLNIHSMHALASLNQRDFNCPLMGGFLLTDWVEGADRFFEPDTEMVFYREARELAQKIEYYLEREDERNAIVRRGRERVLRDHTYTARVPHVLDTLKARIRERYE